MIYRNNEIEVIIRKHIEIIKSKILNFCNPIAIILIGSFGRDEGLVIKKGSEFIFLSDYEIIIILEKYTNKLYKSNISRSISDEIGVETSIAVYSKKKFHNNRNKTASFVNNKPTISSYENKSCAKLIWGDRKILHENKIDSNNIPIWEGMRLIFNRIGGIIKEKQQYNISETKYKYALSKSFISCGDAVLLSLNRYNCLYYDRYQTIKEIKGEKVLHSDFELVLSENEWELIEQAYYHKLFGKEIENYSLTELESILKDIIKKVLIYISQIELGFTFNNVSDFSSYYLKSKKIRNDYTNYQIRSKSFFNTYYDNLIHIIKLRNNGCKFILKLLKFINIPFEQIVYCLLLVVYFNVNDLTKKKSVISEFYNLFYKLEKSNLNEKLVFKNVIKLWNTFCIGQNRM